MFKQLIAFQGKSWQLLTAFVLISLFTHAQTLDTARVRQGVFANPGYDYIGLGTSKTLRPPQDTVKQAVRDSGALSYKNRALYLWDGHSHIPVGGGADHSITTGSRTATGDYIQDWANHWFYLNNLKSLSLSSNRPDPNLPLNNKVFNFYVDSTYNNVAMQLTWGLKDQSNSATDSLHFEVNSTKDYTYLTHWVAKQQKYVELDLMPALTRPMIQILVADATKNGTYQFGSDVAVLNPNDSIYMKAVAATSATKMLALRGISGGIGTVVAMDIPTGGITDGDKGDITVSSSGSAWAIDNNTISNAKAAQMAAHTFKGNNTGSTSNASDLTATQLTAELNVFGASLKGLVPAAAASPSSSKYLSEDGTFSTPAGGGGSPGGSDTYVQINDAGSFFGNSGFTFNKTNRRVYADSLKAIRTQSDSIYSSVLPNYSADTIYYFGDSYSVGVGTTSSAFRWTTMLTGWLGLIEKNYGVSGSTLMKRSPTDPYGTSNLIDRLSSIPTYGSKKAWIVVAYGFNDMGYNAANYTPANFRIDYQTVIDTIKARGWPTHKIILVAPYYASADTYAAYVALTSTTSNDRIRHQRFIDTVQATASYNGARFVNPMSAQLANDSVLLFDNDNVHPNNWGHGVIAQAVYTMITDTVARNGQTMAINGNTELQNLSLKNQDTVTYNASVLGLSATGKVGYFNANRIIKDQPLNQPGQAANINLLGKGLFGNVTSPTAVEVIQANGMIKGTTLRATGGAPSGLTGEGMELAYASGMGLIYGYDRSGAAPKPLSLNFIGEPVLIHTTTANGSTDELLQVNAGGVNAKSGRFTGILSGSGYTGSAAEIGVASSTAVVLGYDRTGGAGINLNLGFGLSPFVIVGSNTVTGSSPFQVNGKSYFSDNIGITVSSPTAKLHLPAGTASANTAPLKFTSGTNLTSPEDGAVEFDGTHFYGTVGSTRYQLDQQSAGGITSINSQTGSSITIAGDQGNTVTQSSNTITVHSPYTLYYSDTSATTVTNTTTQSTLIGNVIGSTSFDGGSLAAGSKIVLKGYGYLNTDAVTPGNLEFDFSVSNFTLGVTWSTLLPTGLSNADYEYEFEITPFTLGTNKDIFYKGKVDIVDNATGAVKTERFSGKGTMTTTGTLTSAVTAQWSIADTDNSVISRNNTLEVKRLQ